MKSWKWRTKTGNSGLQSFLCPFFRLTLLIQQTKIQKQEMISKTVLYLVICFCYFFAQTNQTSKKPVITYITGIWDVKRGNLESMFKRSWEYYMSFFGELLQTQSNLIIFGDSHLKSFVDAHRKNKNTVFILKQLDQFQNQWYTTFVSRIIDRAKETDPESFKMYSGFPQYGLKMYNPVVMSKLYLMKEALSYDIFNSQYFVWLDGGITHVMDKKYVIPQDNAFQRLPLVYQSPFFFHTHNSNQLLYGFHKKGEQYLKSNLNQFVWANFIGGRIQTIETVQSVYQNILRYTLQKYDMWTDESVFSIMLGRYPYITSSIYNITIQQFEYIRFSGLRYKQQEQTRFFKLSMAKNALQCSQRQDDKTLIIVKQARDDRAVRQRMEYKFSNDVKKHIDEQNQEKIASFKVQLIKRGIACLYLFGLFCLIKEKFYETIKQNEDKY